MKKYLVILLFVSLNCFAQKFETGPIIKSGASWYGNSINTASKHAFICSPGFTYSLGWEFKYKLFKKIGIVAQPECKKSGAMNVEYTIEPEIFKFRQVDTYYACLPVKLYFSPTEALSLQFGGEYRYLFSDNIEKNLLDYDLGLLGGLEYKYKRLNIGVEYYLGICPVYTIIEVSITDLKQIATPYGIYNQNLFLTISYRLNKFKQHTEK